MVGFFDPAILAQHIGVLGKTGSGKTTTSKLLVEDVVPAGARVCVLDPIKSDWWGLISSADGKRPGLPFHILGGPHGHVPLHAGAGKAVGEVVASGALPLSIIDMADFPAGGLQRFFVDFAEVLFKRMRGVLYLVIEEAHEFCLSDDTEILTKNGFRKHDLISVGDEAVCFDPATGRFSYGPIERVIRRHWSGEMVHLRSDGLDSLSTPDHRVVLRRVQRGSPSRYKLYDWTFCPASKVPTSVCVPMGGAPIGDGVAGLTPEDARIIGWIITDGNLHPAQTTSPRLALCQSMGTTKMGLPIASEMERVLSVIDGVSRYERPARVSLTMGRTVSSGPSLTWYFGGQSSARFLKWLGSDIHRIPRLLIEQGSRAQLEALYAGLLEGNGTANQGRWVRFYAGLNSGLADDFQEVALRLGVAATKQLASNGQWTILIANERRMHWSRRPFREHYDGLVWDVTVQTGAFVARRNGKVFVTGNCPKERSGIGDENLAIHWGKKLATGGRSKGIRLILSTQRTQSLHNALLGSCDTLIAHRFTAPADQEPVVKWLKANLPAERAKEVAASLSSLKTGEAWLCSGEAGVFERVRFPRISTYDNSATPTEDSAEHQVTTAHVDQEKLRALIGAAVKDAEVNDVTALKARVRELEAQVAEPKSGAPDLAALEAARQDGFDAGHKNGRVVGFGDALKVLDAQSLKLGEAMSARLKEIDSELEQPDPAVSRTEDKPGGIRQERHEDWQVDQRTSRFPERPTPAAKRRADGVSSVQQKILDALAELEAIGAKEPPRILVAHLAGYGNVKSTGFTKALSGLSTAGLIGYGNGTVHLTDAGRSAANPASRPLTNRELHDRIKAHLSGPGRTMLDTLIAAYPQAVDREALARSANYENVKSTGFTKALSQLSTYGFVSYGKGTVVATSILFIKGRK